MSCIKMNDKYRIKNGVQGSGMVCKGLRMVCKRSGLVFNGSGVVCKQLKMIGGQYKR